MIIDVVKELKLKNRPPDFARFCFSLLVLILCKDISIIKYIMLFHLCMSLVWIIIDEKNPLFQREYPKFWLIPASLDIFNSLMIIYVTGSIYSSWVLSLPLITALASSDILRWRGLYSAIGSSIGFGMLLVFVHYDILPYVNLWDSIDTVTSLTVVVQSILLNFVVCISIWATVHYNAISLASITAKASSNNNNSNILLNNLLPKEITGELKKNSEE